MLSLKKYRCIFWDFDGVIKDSVSVKAEAFESLFGVFDSKIIKSIRDHHMANPGVSRFKKIPIYLEWAGLSITPITIKSYLDAYSKTVFNKVLSSPWIPGAYEYITAYNDKQVFILISATPQDEIVRILEELNIFNYFVAVYGSPCSKSNVISQEIRMQKFLLGDYLMVGDSQVDYAAAKKNKIDFLLRCSSEGKKAANWYSGCWTENFLMYD